MFDKQDPRYIRARELNRAAVTRYREKNREKVRRIDDAYRAANRDRVRARNRAWRAANPESERLCIMRARAKRLAAKTNAPAGSSVQIYRWEKEWRQRKRVRCYWCGNRQHPRECNADHIHPLSKGGIHEVGNLCISCYSCNKKKSAKLIPRWNAQIESPVLF